MPPRQRQAPQARRINAANSSQQFCPPHFRHGVIDERRLRIALRRVSQLLGQSQGVQALAAGNSPKPGRQQFVAIGARGDRAGGTEPSSSRRPRRRSRPAPADRLRHRNQRQDEIIPETFKIEALLARQDRCFGGCFDQPEYPRRDA